MLDKNKVLSCTRDGLDIFKHYLPGEWRVGRNFKNPFYDDTKASCNIYFDRRSGMYRMKDFGNPDYDGDCFSLVGKIKNLDCTKDFTPTKTDLDTEVPDEITNELVEILAERLQGKINALNESGR